MSNSENSAQKKKPLFGEIEDVISVGALLRPTIVKAVRELDADDLEDLYAVLIVAERELANSRTPFRERFSRTQDALRATYEYGPSWRFIAARIEDAWSTAGDLTVKELSVVSLLLGILLEETEARVGKKTRRTA